MLRCIAIFHVVHEKCKNSADIQVAVYDLGLNTLHHIIVSQNNWIQNFHFILVLENYQKLV